MEAFVQVVTTTETKADAEKIANTLVEARLAGCAQLLGPIHSTYWWKDKMETAQEWLCVMKTHQGLYDDVEKIIKTLHPYETPEIIAMPIVEGSRDYFQWLREVLKPC